MTLHLLESHPDFIVVDKPAGILVHAHSRFPKERPILQRLRDQIGSYVWPVHRLDRQTSGCLLFARQKEFIEPLAQALQNGSKKYWALVRGRFPHKEEVWVRTPIKTERGNYKEALSRVICISSGLDPRSSLMEVQPKTGRRHQVRRHLRDIHHPILHDGDHGDSRVNRMWKATYGLHRLALHAFHLEFTYKGKTIKCFSTLPKELLHVLTQLPWWEEATEKEPRLLL